MSSFVMSLYLGMTFVYLPLLYPSERLRFNIAYYSTGYPTQNYVMETDGGAAGYGCGQAASSRYVPYPGGVNVATGTLYSAYPTFRLYNQATDYLLISLDSSSFLPGSNSFQCLPGQFATVKMPLANLCGPVAGQITLIMMDHVAFANAPGDAARFLTATPMGSYNNTRYNFHYPLRAPRLTNMELIGGNTFSTWGTNLNWRPDAWQAKGQNSLAGSYILIGNPQPTSPNYVGIQSIDPTDLTLYYAAFALPNSYAGDYFCQVPMSLYGWQTQIGYDGNYDYVTYQNYHQCTCTAALCNGFAYNLFVQENVYSALTQPATHYDYCTQIGTTSYACGPNYCSKRDHFNGTLSDANTANAGSVDNEMLGQSRFSRLIQLLNNRNITGVSPAA